VEGYRDLNHPLNELLVFRWCLTPDVFEGFVSIEELGMVEQANSLRILVGVHALFWHRLDQLQRDVASYVSRPEARGEMYAGSYRPKIT